MNFKPNPKRKPGKNRPASSRWLIQGPQLRDFTKESLKVSPGREYVDLRAGDQPQKRRTPPPDRPVSDLHAEGFCTADSSEPAPVASALDLRLGRDPGANGHHVTFTLALQSSSKVKTNTVPDEFIWPVLK